MTLAALLVLLPTCIVRDRQRQAQDHILKLFIGYPLKSDVC
jgi:hypothetical protein